MTRVQDQFRRRPHVWTVRLTRTHKHRVYDLSPQEIYDMQTKQDARFEYCDYEHAVILRYEVTETETEYETRIAQDQERVAVWQREYDEWQAAKVLAKETKERMAKASRQRYQDPEYIEFLRVRARMQEKGYVE